MSEPTKTPPGFAGYMDDCGGARLYVSNSAFYQKDGMPEREVLAERLMNHVKSRRTKALDTLPEKERCAMLTKELKGRLPKKFEDSGMVVSTAKEKLPNSLGPLYTVTFQTADTYATISASGSDYDAAVEKVIEHLWAIPS